MSLRQRMSNIEPPRGADQETTAELHVEALRELLAATGTARARAATLPCADEVFDDEDVTMLRERVVPPSSRSQDLAATLPLDATVDESGPRRVSAMIPPPPPAPPRPILTSVPCFEGEPEDEQVFEGVRASPSAPPAAELDALADTIATPNSYIRKTLARDAADAVVTPLDRPATPQPFRPGGALFSEGVATRGPEPARFEAAPPSPSYPPAYDAQAHPSSAPPPPVSTRAARTGRLALAACLFVVAFAGGAAIARATTAGADLPHRVWASVRAHV